MNTDLLPPLQRSEAFADDLCEFVNPGVRQAAPRPMSHVLWMLPLAVALLGVAFAVVPLAT